MFGWRSVLARLASDLATSRRLWSSLLLVFVLARGGGVALAHHSFAMFDTAKPITISGVVTAFQWTNPHSYIEVDVADDRGEVRHWSIELGSTSILLRGGWKFNTIKKGDKVSAVVSPLRNGEPGSLLTRITLPDGRVLGNGGPAGVGPGVPPAAAAPQK
jgi:hypothetical protein